MKTTFFRVVFGNGRQPTRSICGSLNKIKHDIIDAPVTTSIGLSAVEIEKKYTRIQISLWCYIVKYEENKISEFEASVYKEGLCQMWGVGRRARTFQSSSSNVQ